jgi:hypothetical protein
MDEGNFAIVTPGAAWLRRRKIRAVSYEVLRSVPRY